MYGELEETWEEVVVGGLFLSTAHAHAEGD
jgi:hypothetical protein